MNKYTKDYTKGDETKDIPKITSLLDIEHFYGEHESPIGPFIITILLALSPPALYVYFGLFHIIPIPVFIPLWIIIAMRVIMIIPGREKYRVKMFRRQLYDEYTAASNMIAIRTIHTGGRVFDGIPQDGLVEYTNGTIAYIVEAYNGTIVNDLQHTRRVKKFINSLVGKHTFDIYIENVANANALNDYYRKATQFSHNDSATQFVSILDHNKDLVAKNSMLQCMVIMIKGNKSDWREMRTAIDSAIGSNDAKCFKSVKLLTTEAEISAAINRNADTVVNINDLLRRKYKTDDYGTSKVLKFDVQEDEVIQIGTAPTQQLLPETSANTFHVAYGTQPEQKLKRKKVKRPHKVQKLVQ